MSIDLSGNSSLPESSHLVNLTPGLTGISYLCGINFHCDLGSTKLLIELMVVHFLRSVVPVSNVRLWKSDSYSWWAASSRALRTDTADNPFPVPRRMSHLKTVEHSLVSICVWLAFHSFRLRFSARFCSNAAVPKISVVSKLQALQNEILKKKHTPKSSADKCQTDRLSVFTFYHWECRVRAWGVHGSEGIFSDNR